MKVEKLLEIWQQEGVINKNGSVAGFTIRIDTDTDVDGWSAVMTHTDEEGQVYGLRATAGDLSTLLDKVKQATLDYVERN